MLYGCIFFWIADSNSVERARAAPISQRPLATTDTDNTVRPERSRPIPGCQPLSFHFFMVVAEPVSTSYYDTKVGQVTLQGYHISKYTAVSGLNCCTHAIATWLTQVLVPLMAPVVGQASGMMLTHSLLPHTL
eukprot:TRINITY_DN8066_c0_g1_i2.p1 TRINITY_DN8066_c0_g1~~TRINITY_DN8066_c0_g1_i2.p1  ORF type:complete len:133 (-),score=2.58 TRINITY_DN8066_c0_g1_i2:195-593(-)